MRRKYQPRYVGRVIQSIRNDRGLSQKDLAVRMGTGQKTVSNVEMDESQPVLGVLWGLEEALGLPHGELTRRSYPEIERLPQEPRRRGRPPRKEQDAASAEAGNESVDRGDTGSEDAGSV